MTCQHVSQTDMQAVFCTLINKYTIRLGKRGVIQLIDLLLLSNNVDAKTYAKLLRFFKGGRVNYGKFN